MTLGPDQEDALKEVINIGMGRAAATLSELMQTRIELTVPGMMVGQVEGMLFRLSRTVGARGLAVAQDFEGPWLGRAALVLPHDSGLRLARILGDVEDGSDELDLELSGILTEVGNIMINSMLGSLANVAGLRLSYGIPQFHSHHVAAFSGSPGVGRSAPDLLLVDTHFQVRQFSIRGSLLFLFERGQLADLVRALGVAEADPEEAR
jgi:chemotaxis protein CheC